MIVRICDTYQTSHGSSFLPVGSGKSRSSASKRLFTRGLLCSGLRRFPGSLKDLAFTTMWKDRMALSFLLLLVSIHFSSPLRLPFNSSVLQLPSQDTILPTGEIDTSTSLRNNPWPQVPYLRYIKNGLTINITAYGDTLSGPDSPAVLHSVLSIQRLLHNAGQLSDKLEAITTVGATKSNVYTEIGFYSLHPSAGIKRSQALDVLHKIRQLLIEYIPAKEITIASIIFEGSGLALFRLSFREL